MSQEELARRANSTAKTISEIENDRTSPSIDTLIGIVEVGLGVTLSAFFGADTPSSLQDDLQRLEALFAAQSPEVRKRALRVLKALCDE